MHTTNNILLFFFKESDYFTPQGEFRVDKAGSPTLLNCLMYKMSYYRFGEMQVSEMCVYYMLKVFDECLLLPFLLKHILCMYFSPDSLIL